METKIIRKRDVKLRRHCPLCETNLVVDGPMFEQDLSFLSIPLRCPGAGCWHKETVQIFLNVDFHPANDRVTFENREEMYRFP